MPLLPARHFATETLVDFIAAQNSAAHQHSLHIAQDRAGVLADLEQNHIDFGQGWLAHAEDDQLEALCGLAANRDRSHGWLYGPWSRSDASARQGVLRELLKAPEAQEIACLHAFADVRSKPKLAELEAAGFQRRWVSHILEVERSAWQGDRPSGLDIDDFFFDRDRAAVGDLHALCFPDSTEKGIDLAQRAGEGAELRVVYGEDGRLAAYTLMSVSFETNEAYIDLLGVDPAYRGRGLGRAMLQDALYIAFHSRGCQRVHLSVRAQNETALALYQSVGFRHLLSGVAMWRKAA